MIGTDFEVRVWETLLSRADRAGDDLFRHRAPHRQAEGRPRRGRSGRAQSDLVRCSLSSRARSLRRADGLPLGPRAQAGDHRLGGGAGLSRAPGLVEAGISTAWAPKPATFGGVASHLT